MSVAGSRAIPSFAVAVALALVGLVVTVVVAKPLAGPFFMFQFAAVVGAALYGGLAPGLVSMLFSGIGYYAVFCTPKLETHQAYRMTSFVLVSVFFVWLAARMRDARTAAELARKRAEAAQARAEAAEARTTQIGAQQERLVAVVSHDLRNPLNAILVSAQGLLRDGSSEREVRSLSLIVNSARRMGSMIRDLLDYARARHASGLPVHLQPSRLGDICRVALDEVRTAHATGRVRLEVAGDDHAAVDPARIEQLVCNLVTNALKHGAPDSPVDVRVTDQGKAIRLDVTNEGAPIPDHLMPTLFDPFRPGDGAGSVGLGLFIVSEIARAHGGSVSARSDEHGTTFTVVFPNGSPASAADAA